MRLPECIGCSMPLLELCGQFEMLSPYYVNGGVPSVETIGEWHTKCLSESLHGEEWFLARRNNYVSVRGYREVANAGDWFVIRSSHRQETIALSRTGASLSLEFPRQRPLQIAGGVVYRVKEIYNLELSDRGDVSSIQGALIDNGVYPLVDLITLLGIEDRMVNIEALRDGVLRYDRSLKRSWGAFAIAVQMEYGVFVPAEINAYVTTK
jgi:hypothetical protein